MTQVISAEFNDLFALNRLGASAREVMDGETGKRVVGIALEPGLPLADDGRTPAGYAAMVATLLGELKVALKAQADSAAEALRLTLITPGSGQAMEYQEAYAEAVQVDQAVKANAAATFDPTAFPMLSASLGYDLDPTTGQPTADIPGEARAVLAAYDAYQRAGAAIRAARLKGKAEIEAASDAAAARAALEAIDWPKLA